MHADPQAMIQETTSPALHAAAGSRLPATPESNRWQFHRDNGYAREHVMVVPAVFAQRMEQERDEARNRLSVIAADAAAIRDRWLEAQPEGIRRVIANIRRHANLSENSPVHPPQVGCDESSDYDSHDETTYLETP